MERNTDREVLVYIQYTKLMEDDVSTDQVVEFINRDEFDSLRSALGIGHVWFHTGQYLHLYSTNNKTLEWKDMEINDMSIWVIDDGKETYVRDIIQAMREIDPVIMDVVMMHYNYLLDRYITDSMPKDLFWYGLKFVEACMQDGDWTIIERRNECEKLFMDFLDQTPENEDEWMFFKDLVFWYHSNNISSLLTDTVQQDQGG